MSIKITLAGSPSCGKTTLFSGLTESSQSVGSQPGVTVERKEGKLKGGKDVVVVDFPGIYSLSPYTLEEMVARNCLITERPDTILDIVDGTNLERNLHLTTQLTELGIPVLMAVNMMNVVKKSGDQINIQALSRKPGCPVVGISALKGTDITEAANKAVELAGDSGATVAVHKFFADVEAALKEIKRRISDSVPEAQKRFHAIKLFERGGKIAMQMTMAPGVGSIMVRMEDTVDDDAKSIVTNECYTYIISIIGRCYTKKSREKMGVSDKTDHIVTSRFLALSTFAVVMWVVYYVSVTTVDTWVTNWANDGALGEGQNLPGLEVPGVPIIMEGFLTVVGCADWLSSLMLSGIVIGVGAVFGFMPQMLVLFIFPAFLESCGYMARAAFVMDRIFRKFGLSGKSFIPMLAGAGCGVPGIMTSRTIENDRDHEVTIMTIVLILCGAKLPIIALLAGVLFGGASWVAPGACFVGIVAIICFDIILKKTRMFAGDPVPFVMKLPIHHLPTVSNVLRSTWGRGWSFIKKAETVILLSTVLVWFTSGFGFANGHFGMVGDSSGGILALIGQTIAWIFAPLGWGSWQAAVAAVTGPVAKEDVVDTSDILYGSAGIAEDETETWGALARSFTAVSAYSLLVFNLLRTPCFAVVGAAKREMNNVRWTRFVIGYQIVFACVMMLCIYRSGSWFTTGTFGIGAVVAIAAVAGFIYLLARPYKKSNSLSANVKVKTAS